MYTRVTGSNFTHCLKKEVITIGRWSQLPIDICLGNSVCISRKHLELHTINGSLFLRILGKNGIFIDEEFQMFGDSLIPLPNCCRLRFPSTSITLVVEILDSNSSLRHPKKRTIWRYSVELAGLTENGLGVSDPSDKKQPNLPSDSKEDEDAVQVEGKPNIQSSSQCKSDSTEPFSTPEPCSPLESFPPNLNQSKCKRPNPTIAEQSASLRFPNLLAAYSRHSPKSVTTSYGRTKSNVNSGLSEQCLPHDQCSLNSPADTESLFPSMSTNEEIASNPERSTEMVNHGTIYEKPPYSYAQLIVQAIISAPNRRLTLSDIYSYISTQFPYYKPNQKGWQNSIRHNLSLNRYFIRTPRGQEEPGKGAFWCLDPKSEAHLVVKAFQNRRQRSYAIPAYMACRASPQRNSESLADNIATTSSADVVVTPPHHVESGDVANSLEYKPRLGNLQNPVSAPLTSDSKSESTNRVNFLAKEAMTAGLSVFSCPTKGLLSHDESILASSLLTAANPLINLSSQTPSNAISTSTSAALIYSRLQSYYNFHDNGISTSSLLPSASALPDSAYMPNLTESLQRCDSNSLSHKVSEPRLQKFSVENMGPAAETAASATTEESLMMQQKV